MDLPAATGASRTGSRGEASPAARSRQSWGVPRGLSLNDGESIGDVNYLQELFSGEFNEIQETAAAAAAASRAAEPCSGDVVERVSALQQHPETRAALTLMEAAFRRTPQPSGGIDLADAAGMALRSGMAMLMASTGGAQHLPEVFGWAFLLACGCGQDRDYRGDPGAAWASGREGFSKAVSGLRDMALLWLSSEQGVRVFCDVAGRAGPEAVGAAFRSWDVQSSLVAARAITDACATTPALAKGFIEAIDWKAVRRAATGRDRERVALMDGLTGHKVFQNSRVGDDARVAILQCCSNGGLECPVLEGVADVPTRSINLITAVQRDKVALRLLCVALASFLRRSVATTGTVVSIAHCIFVPVLRRQDVTAADVVTLTETLPVSVTQSGPLRDRERDRERYWTAMWEAIRALETAEGDIASLRNLAMSSETPLAFRDAALAVATDAGTEVRRTWQAQCLILANGTPAEVKCALDTLHALVFRAEPAAITAAFAALKMRFVVVPPGGVGIPGPQTPLLHGMDAPPPDVFKAVLRAACETARDNAPPTLRSFRLVSGVQTPAQLLTQAHLALSTSTVAALDDECLALIEDIACLVTHELEPFSDDLYGRTGLLGAAVKNSSRFFRNLAVVRIDTGKDTLKDMCKPGCKKRKLIRGSAPSAKRLGLVCLAQERQDWGSLLDLGFATEDKT